MGEAANIKLELEIAIMFMMISAAKGLTDVQRCIHKSEAKCGIDQECFNDSINHCVVPVNVQNQIYYYKIGYFSEKCSKFHVNDKLRETCYFKN